MGAVVPWQGGGAQQHQPQQQFSGVGGGGMFGMGGMGGGMGGFMGGMSGAMQIGGGSNGPFRSSPCRHRQAATAARPHQL